MYMKRHVINSQVQCELYVLLCMWHILFIHLSRDTEVIVEKSMFIFYSWFLPRYSISTKLNQLVYKYHTFTSVTLSHPTEGLGTVATSEQHWEKSQYHLRTYPRGFPCWKEKKGLFGRWVCCSLSEVSKAWIPRPGFPKLCDTAPVYFGKTKCPFPLVV